MKKESGQSLIEVLAALAVVTIAILALVSITMISVRNASFAKNQSLATKYAQEAMEEARQLRNDNRDDFFIIGGTTNTACINLPPLPPSPFSLTRTCSLVDGTKMEIIVTVTWDQAGNTHQVLLKTYLTQW